MRLAIKGTALIDCGGTLADLGKEEMSRRYREKSVLAHAKLSKYEDIDESPKHLAKVCKALKIIKEKMIDISWFYYSDNADKYNSIMEDSRRYLAQKEFDLVREALS